MGDMAEVGRINPEKRMACPHCRALLPEWSVDEVLGAEKLRCPSCQRSVKLPDEVMERARRQRNLGRNLDITC